MKRYIPALFCFAVLTGVVFAQDKAQWQNEKSTHFIIFYHKASPDFIRKVIDRTEADYDNIAQSLGFTRYNFWLWDNRAKIYIYDDLQSYQQGSGQPGWSGGATLPQEKVIQTYVDSPDFFGKILPHELGHIIFREFVGFNNRAVPVWLEEGVASYQENSGNPQIKGVLREAIAGDRLISLNKLMNTSPFSFMDERSIGIFYAESFSIVDHLLKEFGNDKFVAFCYDLRDKKDFMRALSSNYPFSALDDLERSWKNYLKK